MKAFIKQKGLYHKMFVYKRQTKINFIITLIVSLLFAFSFNALAKIEVYFSPDDSPESIIIKNIDNAKESINIAMYSFSDSDIALAVIRAKKRGIDIKIYLDKEQVNAKYTNSRFFINEGIKNIRNIRISSNNSKMHNKFVVIDNKIVITGSYNWTASADERNDENLLVIDDKNIVEKYQSQFNYLWDKKSSLERYNELINHPGVNFPPNPDTSKKIATLLAIC
jgi:phosphatidylserine/phosphatidylglycerophosphate/cardiolipin synthase-like enzyme